MANDKPKACIYNGPTTLVNLHGRVVEQIESYFIWFCLQANVAIFTKVLELLIMNREGKYKGISWYLPRHRYPEFI